MLKNHTNNTQIITSAPFDGVVTLMQKEGVSMTVSKFIKSSEHLSRLDFSTVFDTIYYLIDTGLMDREVFSDETVPILQPESEL